ncbi:hypothetical protein ACQKL5_21030 [Peribacillus sp. NPDC097675]|uniref:hypothetical protein n=1 Tax=Peribacillus sp. NPDC097675 TaxID=3390618 RepID=UPI003D06036C
MSKHRRVKGEKEKYRSNKKCTKCGNKKCQCNSLPIQKVNQIVKLIIDGPIGITGNPGFGATGPTGATGVVLAEYAFIFNNNGQTISVRENVVFDRIGVITSGITYVVGTDVITVNTPGDYEVTFTVTLPIFPGDTQDIINASIILKKSN